jgi:hypothetical protein
MAGEEPCELIVTGLAERGLVYDDQTDRSAIRLLGPYALRRAEVARPYRVVASFAEISPQ